MLEDGRNPAYKEQQDRKLAVMLSRMESDEINTDKNILDVLEENPDIQDLQWSIARKP